MLWQARRELISGNYAAMGGLVAGTEAAAFLARTSGLDATHTNAYINLINGLVADAVWSSLDILHVYATQDSTTAKLNLVSTSFGATVNGSPTFTADRGYTGVDNSGTVNINTSWSMATAGGHYTQNSGHLSIWSVTDAAATGNPAIGVFNGSNNFTAIECKTGSNTALFSINASSISGSNTNGQGHFIASRTSNVQLNGYKNGASIASSGANTSVALANFNLCTLGWNNANTVVGAPTQNAAISVGGGLDSTKAGNLYNRLRTYMTAVGVP